MEKTFENLLVNGQAVDVKVVDGKFAAFTPAKATVPPRPCVPAFYNGHTHLAMSLLRGYADDLELMPWLQEHIWPAEAHLTDDIVYAGTRLAILEMIRSGTVFANDMYWYAPATARAAEEMGVRCAVSMQTLETQGPGHNDPRNVACNRELEKFPRKAGARVFAVYAAHAIYTVSGPSLKTIADRARDEGAFVHIHVAETKGEVENCRKEHGGLTPVAYLDSLGVLGPRTVMAHCVHLTDDDCKRIADTGAVVVENQQSNLKLVSGLFPYRRATAAGCNVILGTDGTCSNNSLSMFAEMKTAALCAKIESGDPTCAPAADVYRRATRGGAQAFGLDAGEIRVGAAADFLILDPEALPLVPGFNRSSDLVYAADPTCIDTVVCAGRVLMEHRVIPGEAEIIAAARAAARQLIA